MRGQPAYVLGVMILAAPLLQAPTIPVALLGDNRLVGEGIAALLNQFGELRSIAICAPPSPPLMHDADALSKLIACAELEVPVIYAPAPAAGASTQRVDKLVRQLGIDGISKSQASRLAVTHDETVEAIRGRPLETAHPHLALDALQVKVREAGCTVSVACGTDADRRYVSLEAHPTHSRSATRRPPRRCG